VNDDNNRIRLEAELERQKTLNAGLGCLTLPLVLVLSALVNGLVLSVLWRWFMVPIFHMQVLTVAQAIGVCITLRSFTASASESSGDDEPFDVWGYIRRALTTIVMRPAVILGIGYVVKAFL